jgi:hypothetical protein
MKANPEELLALWLADQVTAVITDDNKELSAKALDMVKESLKR